MKILTIDDNRDNLTTLQAVLKDALPGCTVSTAQNGHGGIELARAEDPDVILLDIIMPGMDGFEVCRRLKADEILRDIPVVILTAIRTDRESRIRALEAGADAFLSKPPDEQELIAQIRAMAKIKAASQLQRQEKDRLETLVAERTWELQQELAERKRAEEEKAKLEAQLQQAQRMESVGRLAGGVAHDFNNMLSVILGYAQMALEKTDPASALYGDLQEIHDAGVRSANITRQLLAFARKQTISPQILDLNETVESMFKMLRRLIGEDINLTWQPVSVWPVKIDPSQIDQLLANICVNARDAITGVGKITIETATVIFDAAYCSEHTGFAPGDFVLLAISDDGCGMDKEVLGNLFEPFFTTKETGKGTGLGLATVYGIVKQNNGFINVYSEPGKGTTFKIYLPRHSEQGGTSAKQREVAIQRGLGETVFVVEDELSILKLTAKMLEGLGYAVVTASSPTEAVDLAKQRREEIDLLITDVIMPEMNGRDLADALLTIYPDLKCLFMSGYTASVIASQGVLEEGVHFIQKPFSARDLAAKVREVLSSHKLRYLQDER